MNCGESEGETGPIPFETDSLTKYMNSHNAQENSYFSEGEAGQIPFGMDSFTKYTNPNIDQEDSYFSYWHRTYKLLFGQEKVPMTYLHLQSFKTNNYQSCNDL